MSAYAVSKFLFELNRPEVRAAFLDDPESMTSSFEGLTDDERTAILDRDVVYLDGLGISIYLIRTLELVSGTNIIATGQKFGGLGPRVITSERNTGEQ